MRRATDLSITCLSWVSVIVVVGATSAVIAYLFIKGGSSLSLRLIFGDTPPFDALLLRRQVFDGLFPAMAGTFALVILSVTWAIPVGVFTGIYLAEYASPRVKALLNFLFDILAGIPSIVIGLFGFSLAVFLHKNYSTRIQPCLLISSVALAFLVLPYLIRTTQTALESIPAGMRLSALALGATKLQNITHVLIPQSFSGIMSGVILAIGRCAEDTAVIMLTGVVASAGVPKSLLSNYEALPFFIYYISSQYRSPEELSMGYGAAIILLALCVVLFSLAFFIKKRLIDTVLFKV